MNLEVITPPPFEPVTLDEVYLHLRLDPDGSPREHIDDPILRTYIAASRQWVEEETRRSLVQQTLRLTGDGFGPVCGGLGGFRLLRPPVIRVLGVSYFDGENLRQDLDPTDYYLSNLRWPMLRLPGSFTPPTLYRRPDALQIDYVAGYAPDGSPPETQEDFVASIPPALKSAVLLGVQLLYDNLAAEQRGHLERTRLALISPFRVLFV